MIGRRFATNELRNGSAVVLDQFVVLNDLPVFEPLFELSRLE